MKNEPWQLGVAQAARAIADRRLSPAELVRSLLERSERVERDVRAWARLARDAALREAEALGAEIARGRARGPLHGVPIAVKDNVAVAGLEMNVGSPLMAGHVPASDAPLVRRLREAGAIVLGKTAMTEFAAMDPAPTRNPWNLAHTPGGSSSGSAAAVAAFLAPAALGTQTAGSIVRPAAYCGVVGLKPTYGAVPRAGVFPCAWSMDHVGPLARSVEDAALVFRVLAGRRAAAGAGGAARVGVADRYFMDQADADTQRAFEAALQALSGAGAELVPTRLPKSFEAGVDAGVVTMYCEMAAVHRERFAAQRERFGWKLACLLEAGAAVGAADYLRAQQIRAIAAAELSDALRGLDCLATPATPAPAPRGLGATGDWTLNLPFSSSGHPTLAVPVGLSGAGLPIGVQLAARHGGEALLFHCGALLERAVAFTHEAGCQ
ncbi:MAG TPA: amidase [Burkholderiales bacterium]